MRIKDKDGYESYRQNCKGDKDLLEVLSFWDTIGDLLEVQLDKGVKLEDSYTLIVKGMHLTGANMVKTAMIFAYLINVWEYGPQLEEAITASMKTELEKAEKELARDKDKQAIREQFLNDLRNAKHIKQ